MRGEVLTDEDALRLLSHLLAFYGMEDSAHTYETPQRIANLWLELFATKEEFSFTVFPNDEGFDQIVAVYNVNFASFCAHHLLPFVGTAAIGYIPYKKYVGLSKLVRSLDFFARRPQTQERLTQQLGEFLNEKLEPLGIGVIIRADHTCMSGRGVYRPGTKTVTSYLKGALRENATARAEFLKLIGEGT